MPEAQGDGSKISVVLAPALVALFPGASLRLEVAARSVGEVIDALDARWPGMGDRLRDTSPSVRRHINIFCDGERATLGTELRAGACVYVLTAVSGG
jgi:sulfur-carrier protein